MTDNFQPHSEPLVNKEGGLVVQAALQVLGQSDALTR